LEEEVKMKRKSLALPILTIMALTVFSLACAQWSQALQINGIVKTGELRIEFMKVHGGGEGGTITIIDNTKLEWIITNAYPGWSGVLHCTMKNVGTIPLKFKEAKLTVVSDQKGLMAYMKSGLRISYDQNGRPPKDVKSHWVQKKWGSLDELDDKLNADSELRAMVLYPGGWLSFGEDEGSNEHSLYLKIDEDAPNEVENAMLNFVLEITFEQWNP
jgi:hypothetical protein